MIFEICSVHESWNWILKQKRISPQVMEFFFRKSFERNNKNIKLQFSLKIHYRIVWKLLRANEIPRNVHRSHEFNISKLNSSTSAIQTMANEHNSTSGIRHPNIFIGWKIYEMSKRLSISLRLPLTWLCMFASIPYVCMKTKMVYMWINSVAFPHLKYSCWISCWDFQIEISEWRNNQCSTEKLHGKFIFQFNNHIYLWKQFTK